MNTQKEMTRRTAQALCMVRLPGLLSPALAAGAPPKIAIRMAQNAKDYNTVYQIDGTVTAVYSQDSDGVFLGEFLGDRVVTVLVVPAAGDESLKTGQIGDHVTAWGV